MEKLKQYKIFFYIMLVVTIIFNLGMFLIYKKYHLNNSNICFFSWIIGNIIFGFIFFNIRKNFIEIISNLFKEIARENNVEYFPDKAIDPSYYLQIESGMYDKYSGKDYTKGNNFEFSYVHTTREREKKDENGNIVTTEEDVFEGTIYKSDFFYNSKKRYLVKPNSLHLDDFLAIDTEKDRIKLDNPEFEKKFDVYGEDQIEGRMIFNHNFMENLIKIYDMIGDFKMVIKDGVCIISIKNKSPIPIGITNFNEENLEKVKVFYINLINMHQLLDDKNLII
jgi:hypothetical protein